MLKLFAIQFEKFNAAKNMHSPYTGRLHSSSSPCAKVQLVKLQEPCVMLQSHCLDLLLGLLELKLSKTLLEDQW